MEQPSLLFANGLLNQRNHRLQMLNLRLVQSHVGNPAILGLGYHSVKTPPLHQWARSAPAPTPFPSPPPRKRSVGPASG